MTVTANITPIEAYAMDAKMDDGAPLTGLVQVHATAGTTTTTLTDPPASAVAATSGDCTMGDAAGTALTDSYNRNLTLGGQKNACMVRFRFN